MFNPESRGLLQTNDLTAYNYDELQNYEEIPSETKQYFKEELEKGQSRIRLFYQYVPHVLYHGPIDTTDFEIVTSY